MQHLNRRKKHGTMRHEELSSTENPAESCCKTTKGAIPVSRHKMIITLLLGILLITAVTVVVWALFTGSTKTAANAIAPGYVDISVKEPDCDYVIKPEGDGYAKINKQPTVVNNGPGSVWVRVMLAGGIKFFTIDYNTSNDPNGYWIDGNDGYWYYSKLLDPNDTNDPSKLVNVSAPVFSGVTPNTSVISNKIDTAELDIAVYAEAIQYKGTDILVGILNPAKEAFDSLSTENP